MGGNNFTKKAIKLVAAELGLKEEQIYVVWLVKVLQNNKAMLSTSVDGDGVYVEATYNGDKEEMYLDFYNKEKNVKVNYFELNAL